MPNTSWLTDAIIEAVDEALDILTELLEDEDMGLGILEWKVPQDILRQRFMEIAETVDLAEYERLSGEFVQDFGEEELQRQMGLASRRKGNG